MGQSWDGFDSLESYQDWIAIWSKLLIEKALYPGAVALFFGGTRTFHHLGVGLERGGFEILDCLMWIYGSGFPKSLSPARDASRHLLEADTCQCDANRHSSERTFPFRNVLDRICMARPFSGAEGDISSSGLNETSRPQDSLDDYQLSGRSRDESLRLAAEAALAFLPQPEYVPKRIHSFLPEDGLDDELAHSLYLALCSDLPSMRDCLDLGAFDEPFENWPLPEENGDQRQNSVQDWRSALSNMVGSLSASALMADDKLAFDNWHISSLVACLPYSALLMLWSGKRDAIIPLVNICSNCSKMTIPFAGHSTALKPAWEPVYVCRAPRGDMTFAELATEFGTGALNIDGSRVGYASEDDKAGATPQGRPTSRQGGLAGGLQDDRERIDFERPEQKGRWPANLVLTHHEACVRVGEYTVPGRVINRWKEGMLPFGGGAGQEYETVDPSRAGEQSADRTYEHEGGTDFAMRPGARRGVEDETVDLYACVPGCPVRELDDQAGELISPGHPVIKKESSVGYQGATYGKESREAGTQMIAYGDSGGPSRFFYTAKSSRSEKDKGLENFYWKRMKDGNWERVSEEKWAGLDRSVRGRGNIHPTCKPLELLRYLATLVLPPKQEGRTRRMLVPFSGSGSEIIGAIQAGWDEVEGVEMEEIYVEMAEARINATTGML